MVNLLLGCIGMIFSSLEISQISKSESPNSRLTIQISAFSVVLDYSIPSWLGWEEIEFTVPKIII